MASLRMQRRRSMRSDGGATLVEFALILPVFMMLIFGMISTGLALNEKQEMTQATREGARYAATIPADQTGLPDRDGNGTPDSWAVTVRHLIADRSSGTLEPENICVSLVQGSSPTTAITTASHASATYFSTAPSGAACIAGQTYPVTGTDDGRRVQVTATKDATIELLVFGSFDITLKADATAKSESRL